MSSHILIAVDSSEPAQRAVDEGSRLAMALGAIIKLVHVVHPIAPFMSDSTSSDLGQNGEAKSLIKKLRGRISLGVEVDDEVRHGVPAEQIVIAAKEWDADLVIVGAHNRHILSRFLLGSVADAVVRHAPCSVMVVRAKDVKSSSAHVKAGDAAKPPLRADVAPA